MELLWAALPMAGCALMMVVMMRMMAGGNGSRPPAAPDPTDERRAVLEAEVEELRTRLGEADRT